MQESRSMEDLPEEVVGGVAENWSCTESYIGYSCSWIIVVYLDHRGVSCPCRSMLVAQGTGSSSSPGRGSDTSQELMVVPAEALLSMSDNEAPQIMHRSMIMHCGGQGF